MSLISVEKFGKDHWSLLAYVESCCVDGRDGIGRLDRSRMRCNEVKRPLLTAVFRGPSFGWSQSHGTRLSGFFKFEDCHDSQKSIDAGLLLAEHDDWDCLDDLEGAGFVEILSLVNGHVKMTVLGQNVAGALRSFKAQGGKFADFGAVYASLPESVKAGSSGFTLNGQGMPTAVQVW